MCFSASVTGTALPPVLSFESLPPASFLLPSSTSSKGEVPVVHQRARYWASKVQPGLTHQNLSCECDCAP